LVPWSPRHCWRSRWLVTPLMHVSLEEVVNATLLGKPHTFCDDNCNSDDKRVHSWKSNILPVASPNPSPIQPIVTTIRRGFDAMRSSGVANLCIGVSAYRPLSAFKTQEINVVLKTSGRCTTTTTNRNSTLTAGLDLLQAGPRFRKNVGSI